jgi:anti-sigma regulatory factor (Ser/Thr protein kinase)
MSTALHVKFRSDPATAAAARRGLERLHGAVDEGVLEDLRLLVSELVTNSVRHAAPGTISLSVEVGAGRIRVEVADEGRGFDIHDRLPARHTVGGWGLLLVDQLADRWGVTSEERTRVWLEIDTWHRSGWAAA